MDEDRLAWNRHPLVKVDWVLALGFLLLGIAARVPFILRGETLLNLDEAVTGIMAQDIAAGRRFPIFFYGQRYMGALEAYVIAALFTIFTDQVIAIRTGPALFFGGFVAVQFLMLTRWFGRTGGVVGAASLILCSPAMLQWTLAPRGAYIEVLFWGSLFLWAYAEQLVQPKPRFWLLAAIGFLAGSGLWLNTAMVVFILAVFLHAALRAIPEIVAAVPLLGQVLERARSKFGLLLLPLLVVLCFLILGTVWTTRAAGEGEMENVLFFGLLPKWLVAMVALIVLVPIAWWLTHQRGLIDYLRGTLNRLAPVLLFFLLGQAPEIFYVLGHMLQGQPLEQMVAIGPRPFWEVPYAFWAFLVCGLQVMMTPDASDFCVLMEMYRYPAIPPLAPFWTITLTALGYLAAACFLATGVTLVRSYGRDLRRLARLEPCMLGPVGLMTLGVVLLGSLYLVSGITFDFSGIRYLVPLLLFLPGMLAAAFMADKGQPTARVAILLLFVIYAVGQGVFWARLGGTHMHVRLAEKVRQTDKRPLIAEILDSYPLNFLNQQDPPVWEFDPYWPRTPLDRPRELDANATVTYLVDVSGTDWSKTFVDGGYPGPIPPNTTRVLHGRLVAAEKMGTLRILEREPVGDGFELWTVSPPLPEPNRAHGAQR